MKDLAVVGPWAKDKLDTLGRYLEFYCKVLKNRQWRTIYVDAFAGGGRAVVRGAKIGSLEPSLFDDDVGNDPDARELIDGSPRVALKLADPFDRNVFIDPDPKRVVELEALKTEFVDSRNIVVLQKSAADGIAWVISQNISKDTHRGVAFLDPFGAKLEWASIQKLADTKLFEVVVNFALNMALIRMMPNDGKVPVLWEAMLDRYFGTHEWFDEVYQREGGLFATEDFVKRQDYAARLLDLYRRRLKEAFGFVSSPRLIKTQRGVPLYYLLWAGPHDKGLKGAEYILTMGERLPAKRKRSSASNG